MQSTNVYLLLFLASVNATKCRDSLKHQESEAPFDWKKSETVSLPESWGEENSFPASKEGQTNWPISPEQSSS